MNVYFIIYKPYLVLSQFSPADGKRTLSDLFSVPRDVYPVGRLDHDSEGLLLLTNDTSLNNALLDPRFAHEREYWVQVDGAIDQHAIDRLKKGVTITTDGKNYRTRPCGAFIFPSQPLVPDRDPPIRFRKSIPAPWIRLILTEGKNRQVRRMTAHVGFPTLRLIRHRIGQLSLDSMRPGDITELSYTAIQQKLFHGKDI